MNHSALAFSLELVLPLPSRDDRTADAERLKEGLRLAGLDAVLVPAEILRRLPEELRRNDFRVALVMARDERNYRVLDIHKGPVYGIALDIGSTTLAAALFELNSGKRLGVLEAENPQIRSGADVLSRVQLAIAGNGDELSQILRQGIDSLVARICAKNGVDALSVYAVAAAGNTIMSHFFLGLDVRNIPVAPNVPVVGGPVFCSGADAGIAVSPNALVYVFPNAGSYVGGDIISGLISADILETDEPVLFMDVGTNVELALGCRDWIMVGAGAAGPALEGGVTDIGMKAEEGAINAMKISGDILEPMLTVISGAEPSGICGSGLIDLVSELFGKGIIDQAGRFIMGKKGVFIKDGEPSYLLHKTGDRELFFRERELQNFLRSKAAMFAFLQVFLRLVGMKAGDVEKIYVAGALGCGINFESAVNIGMLPDIPADRIVPLGNASLRGASMLLIDNSLIEEAAEVRSLITYREMSEDAELLNELQAAMFIPHTDPSILKG